MSREAFLYFFACSFLWCVISAFHYLSLDVAETEASRRARKWFGGSGRLAHWVIHECFFVDESAQIARSEARMLYDAAETKGESLIVQWGDKLHAASHKAYEAYQKIDERTWLYYYYCRWFARTLAEFNHILQEPGFHATEFYRRFQANAAEIEELARLLNNEQPDAPVEESTSSDLVEVLKTDVETLATQLAAEWRQAVYSATTDPNITF